MPNDQTVTVNDQTVEKVKTALHVRSSIYDDEIDDLIDAAKADLGLAGVIDARDTTEPLILQAIKTYCRMHFHHLEASEYDRLKASYDEQKAQLQTATGHTDWMEAE